MSAFRATLEEVVEADLILHVVDVSDPDRDEKHRVVLDVLREIGAGDQPRLTVYNKADLLGSDDALPVRRSNEVVVSAVTGEGLDKLIEQIVHEMAAVKL